MKINFAIFILITISFTGIFASGFYVSVDGNSNGNGSIENPWDIQTALNHPSAVKPGDTIWLMEGIYNGEYISKLKGTNNNPIIVRAMPGENVVLDNNGLQEQEGVLNIEGEYTWFWGLNITTSNTSTQDNFSDGVYFIGRNCKLINCRIFNNGGNGIGFWRPATNSEIYGCVIYHNGNRGVTRGHGHGIYAQNETGTKIIRDNIMFNSFGIGIHIYTEGGAIQGFLVEGNTIFNSGLPGADFIERNIIVGGGQPADRIQIKNNFFYNRPAYPSKASVQLGYSVSNIDAEFSGNSMVDGSFYVIKDWNSVKCTENKLYSRTSSMQLIAFDNFNNIENPEFNNNNYHGGTLANDSFDDWKALSGQDISSTYSSTLPQETQYFLTKNKYEAGRGHITVFNWGGMENLEVNLSDLLQTGALYEIWDVSNFAGGPVVSGTFSGEPVSLPLTLTDVELPTREGVPTEIFKHTLPAFGVFIVKAISGGIPVNISSEIGSENNRMKIVRAYPNPITEILTIDFTSTDNEILSVTIYNKLGQLVNKENYTSRKGNNRIVINCSNLHSGIYFITISGKKETTSWRILQL